MSSRESYSDGLRCQLHGRDVVRSGIELARSFADAQHLHKDQTARLCIVVEELVANLRDHGGLGDEGLVELSLAREANGIRINIADFGQPFDPRSVPSRSGSPERGGGVGIELVRAWSKFIDYQVTPNGNRLELLLRL